MGVFIPGKPCRKGFTLPAAHDDCKDSTDIGRLSREPWQTLQGGIALELQSTAVQVRYLKPFIAYLVRGARVETSSFPCRFWRCRSMEDAVCSWAEKFSLQFANRTGQGPSAATPLWIVEKAQHRRP